MPYTGRFILPGGWGEARGIWDGRPARGSALTSSIEVWGGVPEALLT